MGLKKVTSYELKALFQFILFCMDLKKVTFYELKALFQFIENLLIYLESFKRNKGIHKGSALKELLNQKAKSNTS